MAGFLVLGLLTGATYALLAVGFVLVYKGTRVFNLAQGEIGALGLYVAWAMLPHVPVLVAVIAGVAIAAATGVAMERLLVRRLVDRTPLAALAATLGAGLTLAYAEALIWGIDIKTFPSPFGNFTAHISSVTLTSPRVASLVAAGAVAIGLAVFLKRTRFGMEVTAATSDPSLARLSGVRVGRTRMFVWAMGGALSGLAAILIASVETFHPLSVTLVMVRALTAALLGGLTSISGAFFGGLAVGVVDALVVSRTTVAGASDAAILVLLLVALLVRPQGVFGAREATA
jgi:branched-subunit amino acid ABC-type transport system permease component